MALVLGASSIASSAQEPPQNRRTAILDSGGEQVLLYEGSYALVLGVSRYTNGWRSLPGVRDDVDAVAEVLREHGFEVTGPKLDLDSGQLKSALESFVNGPGAQPGARLLIYFAGHGATLRPAYGGSPLGYLVPADAPKPEANPDMFRNRALSMLDIDGYARKIQSRHALFVFDSCFAGTVFEVMRSGQVPEYVSDSVARPVRQFITSGEAEEEVPDRSRFARVFVEALRGGAVEGDGYLTGRELGQYLYRVVSEQTGGAQHPQYGQLPGVLGQGDFVFELPRQPVVLPPRTGPLNLEDLRRLAELEAAKVEWQSWQARMLQDLREVAELEEENISPQLKAQAWAGFQVIYQADNPYSEEDDASRRRAVAREEHWRSLGDAAEVPPSPPPPVLRPGAEMPEPPLPGMRFRYIPAGTFQMGSPDDEPGRDSGETLHQVTLTRGYWMSETEVTQAQWQAVMGNNPSRYQDCGETCPVEEVNWYEAVVFANALSHTALLEECYELKDCSRRRRECEVVLFLGLDCQGYRLPTEAEWERAARAGSDSAVYTGDLTLNEDAQGIELDAIAWFRGNQVGKPRSPQPVGQKAPNAWGLRDILGNVEEWTWDKKGLTTESVELTDPLGPEKSFFRVKRGCSWLHDAEDCRSAYRGFGSARRNTWNLGIRLVRTAP